MQADVSEKFAHLEHLGRQISALSRLRALGLNGLALGVLLLVFSGSARPAQPLLAWLMGMLFSGLSLPVLLVSQLLLQVRQDAHRGLVRHLFRRGHHVEYPEFPRHVDTGTTIRVESHAPPGR
ncbi:MAG: hypothetical protein U5K56_12960 [Halioglobus sp.]|nr:hypothetical protein [Halioglobus sp.]